MRSARTCTDRYAYPWRRRNSYRLPRENRDLRGAGFKRMIDHTALDRTQEGDCLGTPNSCCTSQTAQHAPSKPTFLSWGANYEKFLPESNEKSRRMMTQSHYNCSMRSAAMCNMRHVQGGGVVSKTYVAYTISWGSLVSTYALPYSTVSCRRDAGKIYGLPKGISTGFSTCSCGGTLRNEVNNSNKYRSSG